MRLIGDRTVLADVEPGDALSLLPISDFVRVSTTGLQYELDDETLHRAASRGVSNVVRQPPIVIDVHSGRLLVIHDRREDCVR